MAETKQTQTQTETQAPHVAILPSPGMGHLIPLVELAKRLVQFHNFSITFVVPTDGSPTKAQKSVLDSLPPSVDYVFLPPADLKDVDPDARIETIISLTVARSLSSLRTFLESFSGRNRLVALVVDLFGTDAFDVAREFGISPYIFFPSTAMALSLFLYLPKLHETVTCEYRDLNEPVRIPGCIPVQPADLLDPLQDRKNDAYRWLIHHVKRYRMAEGVMVNTFTELEEEAIKALQAEEPGKPPVYPVGPLVNMGSTGGRVDGSECLSWLDEQPHGSVLFVSFGSGGSLSYGQITELALGLEMSEQRFLWVVRSPNDKVANATFFSVHSEKDPFGFLPKGFADRTKGRGGAGPAGAGVGPTGLGAEPLLHRRVPDPLRLELHPRERRQRRAADRVAALRRPKDERGDVDRGNQGGAAAKSRREWADQERGDSERREGINGRRRRKEGPK